MLHDLDRAERLARITYRLDGASVLTKKLLVSIVDEARDRLAPAGHDRPDVWLRGLIDVSAWTDAALNILKLALPCWDIRHVAYDEGLWRCALSRARDLPDWLDDTIETSHPDLAAAILKACVEAMQRENEHSITQTLPPTAQPILNDTPMCCDNFG